MSQILAAMGFRRVASTGLMTRLVIWAMRADLR
jgi:hypothetical protein